MSEMENCCRRLGIKLSKNARRAGKFLEERGHKFGVEFGYVNAEEKARELYNLNLEPLSIDILNGKVLSLLRESDWWAPWEICRQIQLRWLVLVSDSSVTARIRDLRKPRYGSHVIEKRMRDGSRAYEYRLVKA